MTSIFSGLPHEDIPTSQLKGKRLAINGTSFLSEALKEKAILNAYGAVISHLIHMFRHVIMLLSLGAKPVYVFDGQFLEIKKHDIFAKELPEPRITLTLTSEMIVEVKHLLQILGIPIVQAPAEGDAQAAHLCEKGEVHAVAATQFDPLMYGAKRIILGLKKGVKKVTQYELKKILAANKMDYNQFVMVCILVGTDFNPPVEPLKNAIRVVQKYHTFTRTFEKIKWQYAYLPKAVYEHIKTMPVTNKYQLRWSSPDKKGVLDLFVAKHGLNEKRVLEMAKTK